MDAVTVSVRAAPVFCWSCGAETRIVSSIALSRGPSELECSISDFTVFPQLVESIEESLRGQVEIGKLKLRYSRTLACSYMSNGCAHCDALQGQHYEIHSRYDEQLASQFLAHGKLGWDAMIAELEASEDGHLF